jgi:hypothetical protein
MLERSDRQFEAIRQQFSAEMKAVRAEFSAETKGIHCELKNIRAEIHAESKSIRESIASMRVWAVTFGFGLAAGILSLMAKGFGWLH